jgi:predicted RND superfamily exporter protein
VLRSVLIVIVLLYVVMAAVLFAYFRRWRDIAVTLSGVTAAVPLVLAEMRLLGQPFSTVNSQVLTLVVIVGVAHALHHVEEYRRRREADLEHADANRSTFRSIAFPSFMTGLSVVVGFLALRTADMPAVRSFGLSTAVGVATVYCMNWLLVPMLVDTANRTAPAQAKPTWASRCLLRALGAGAEAVDRRPWRLVAAFCVTLAAIGAFGLPRLSVNQLVNEELHKEHPVLKAQQLYESQFSASSARSSGCSQREEATYCRTRTTSRGWSTASVRCPMCGSSLHRST